MKLTLNKHYTLDKLREFSELQILFNRFLKDNPAFRDITINEIKFSKKTKKTNDGINLVIE